MPDHVPELPGPDLAHADIGIVYATKFELDAFIACCDRVRKYTGGPFVFHGGRLGNIKVALVRCGMGFAVARRATQALLDAHSPRWVISAGFSGALHPSLRVGDIVVATSLVDTHGQELHVDLKMPADPAKGLHVGRLLTVDHMVRKVSEKEELGQKHGALAVDMESLAVAQVCRDSKTRFLAIRVVSDDLAADLPAEILTVVGSSGTVRLGAALASIWKRPGSVKDMWRLREQSQHAAERLTKFLDGVIEQLHAAK
jgi:adenosylhomocysteine nucleosidase